jgi:Caspase domain/WD domain, G-beta repeat
MPRTVTRLPDPARSQVILIGTAEHGTESDLLDLPAVANNLDDLHAALADPTHGWLTPHAGTKILNPDSPDQLGITIAKQAARADDLMLIYYAGHGLLSPRGELYLATSRTSREQLRFTAFPFDGIREILNDSPAANRVVILDCCYSGRPIAAMSDPQSAAYDQLDITGTYILTSTTATSIAHAPDGARHTAFTGELIRLLRDGDRDIPELVTLDHIYRATYRALNRQGLPRPQQRGSNATPHLALIRNHALGRQPVKTESPDPPDGTMSADALAAELSAVAASTPILIEAESPVAGPADGYPPPQPLVLQAPYPQRPASPSGIAITAMILCTISSLSLIWSAISTVVGLPPFSLLSDTYMPPEATLLDNGAWSIGDILLIIGTILMWGQKSAGRRLAITGLSMVLISVLSFELVALSTPDDIVVRPWIYPVFVFTLLSLAVALLSGTGRYLKAGHPSSFEPTSPHRRAARPRIEPSPRPEPLPGARSARPAGKPLRRVHTRKALLVVAACALVATTVAFLVHPGQDGGCSSPPGTHSPASLTCALTATLSDPNGDNGIANNGVNSLAFAPGGTALATADGDGRTYLWDTATGKLTATLTEPDWASVSLDSVAFAPGGTTLAVGASDINGGDGGYAYLLDTATGKRIYTITDPYGDGVDSVAFAPGGTTLAVGDGLGNIYLWDTTTRKRTATFTDPDNASVKSVAFGPGGAILAVGDEDGSTYLWDTTTRKITATFTVPNGFDAQSVAFGPGGTTVAVGAGSASGSQGDENTYLWNTATRKLTATFSEPNGEDAASVAVAPGGTTLAASDGYITVYLWDTATRKLTAILTDPSDSASVGSVAFGPGGTTLAVGDGFGRTYLWRITRHNP